MGEARRNKINGRLPKTVKPVVVKPAIPHYTADDVVKLLNSNDSRIEMNEYGTDQCIVLSDVPGYFKYSDKMGGIATFYRGDTHEPVFTASREITDEIRNAKCDADCNCDSKWTDLMYNCGCKQHHDGESYDVFPRIEACNTTDCDGTHGHLIGMCRECFDIDVMVDGKSPKDANADNIRIQLT